MFPALAPPCQSMIISASSYSSRVPCSAAQDCCAYNCTACQPLHSSPSLVLWFQASQNFMNCYIVFAIISPLSMSHQCTLTESILPRHQYFVVDHSLSFIIIMFKFTEYSRVDSLCTLLGCIMFPLCGIPPGFPLITSINPHMTACPPGLSIIPGVSINFGRLHLLQVHQSLSLWPPLDTFQLLPQFASITGFSCHFFLWYLFYAIQVAFSRTILS